ncbi:hypothetical protein AwWohl_01220 [Gammaproteobacteria bacterium]|nr:hypothetical protein AwWohl_01220 [Gammaproteobacteria bacterium]
MKYITVIFIISTSLFLASCGLNDIKRNGSVYPVVPSEAVVSIENHLVDLKTAN